jgi:transcriptional regulator with XRE-family HTH domain
MGVILVPKISLKAARVNAGLTQAESAERIGVSVSTIKNWEVGRSFPNQPMIEKICEVYGVSYDYIKFF